MSASVENRETPNPTVQHRSVIGGIGWNFFAIMGEQASSLIAFVVIARILGPEDFGIVVLTVALVDILISFVRAGISETLIRLESISPTELGTAFWLNMSIGFSIGIVVLLSAPELGSLLNIPKAIPLLQAMTVVFPVAAAGAIAEALLSRKMAFSAVARRQIIGSLLGALASISLAFLGFGGWSMIAQRITIVVVGASLSIWAAGLVPPCRFSFEVAKRLLHSGSGFTTINLLYRLQPRIAELAIGIVAQPVSVALYRAASRIVDLVSQLPMQPLMRVVFPTLSRITGDTVRFNRTLLQFVGSLGLILMPIYAGIGYFGHDIFHLLFGQKWDAAVPAFVLLLIAGGIGIPVALLGPASSARGGVRYSAWFCVLDVGVNIALMLSAASFGIHAIAGSRIVGAILVVPFAYLLLMKPGRIRFIDLCKALGPAFGITAALLGGLFMIDYIMKYFGLNFGLFLGIPACIIIFVSMAFIFLSRQIKDVLELMNTSTTRKILALVKRYQVAS